MNPGDAPLDKAARWALETILSQWQGRVSRILAPPSNPKGLAYHSFLNEWFSNQIDLGAGRARRVRSVGYSKFVDRFDQKWRTLQPHSLETRSDRTIARHGRMGIKNLPIAFRRKHVGEYIAISDAGEVLHLASDFETLCELLRRNPPSADYYVARLGSNSIAEVF